MQVLMAFEGPLMALALRRPALRLMTFKGPLMALAREAQTRSTGKGTECWRLSRQCPAHAWPACGRMERTLMACVCKTPRRAQDLFGVSRTPVRCSVHIVMARVFTPSRAQDLFGVQYTSRCLEHPPPNPWLARLWWWVFGGGVPARIGANFAARFSALARQGPWLI